MSDLVQLELLVESKGLIIVSLFGGFVLFCSKVAEHFNRDEVDKFSIGRYIAYMLCLFLFLPTLGGGVTFVYILNGDDISPILAFQIGLTSPGIVQGMLQSAANQLIKEPIETDADQ